jgi:hypothetical protein
MADEKDKGGTPPPPNPPARRKRVEVLVDNLGPKLKKQGEITSDPDYVRLSGDKRKVVREVQE